MVQKEYMTPFNSKSHTSPSVAHDLQVLCDYLKNHLIQIYFPGRENNNDSIEARDLIQAGAGYADKPTAFRNFEHVKYKLKNLGIPDCAAECNSEEEDEAKGPEGVTEDRTQ